MGLPPFAKTWYFSPNNQLLTNGTSNSDYGGRFKDVADFLGTVVTQVLALAAANGISVTCLGSSDGGLGNVTAPLDGVNRWVSGSSTFRTSVTNAINNTGNSSWVVLAFPDGILMMCFWRDNNAFAAYWADAGVYIPPTTTTDRPTLSILGGSESLVCYFSLSAYPHYYGGAFNQENDGIVNANCSYSNYTQSVQIALAGDGSGFWAISFRDNVPAQVLWFGGLNNPVTNWDTAKLMFISGIPTVSQLCGVFSAWGAHIRASLDTTGVDAVIPAIITNTGINNGNYQYLAMNPVTQNGIADTDTGAYPILPIGIYSPSKYGIKGTLTDLWWGAAGGNQYTYPDSPLIALQFVQAYDLIFPWDGLTAPLFA
jgi:hypothetical protein